MRNHVLLISAMAATTVVLVAAAAQESKLQGWVTKFDPATGVIEVNGETISLRGIRTVGGGRLAVGAFVSIDRGQRMRVKEQQRPVEDVVGRFPAKQQDNPGRTEFSHFRHFNALGQKQCKTCHSPEMGLRISSTYTSRAPDPTIESHAPASLGRFCAACHNGTTRVAEVGAPGQHADIPIFTALKTGDRKSCDRCHTPADHRNDFTGTHGDAVERAGARACGACHATDWTEGDRQQHAEFLAAEKALTIDPDDMRAGAAVGPNNFCVYCHRTDREWRK